MEAPTSNTDEQTSILSFSVTAMSQKDIDYVIKEIEEVGNEAMKDIVLDSEQYQNMIARLTEVQVGCYSEPIKIFYYINISWIWSFCDHGHRFHSNGPTSNDVI